MTSARVHLRYRPGADVLSGTVALVSPAPVDGVAEGAAAADDEVVEAPDADTTLTWRGGVLSSFQLVFAAARTGQGPLPLPAALWPTVDSLIVTAMHAVDEVDDIGTRMRARAEATCEVPLEALMRPAHAEAAGSPHQLALARRTAERLSRSLAQLADAVHTRVPVDDEVEALHTDHLARLLRELSSTLELHDTTTPGATAATRVAARAGEALKPAELDLLESALAELDDPAAWAHAEESLGRLVMALAART